MLGSNLTLSETAPRSFPHLPWGGFLIGGGCPALNIAPLPLLWPNCGCHGEIRAVAKAERGEQHLGGGESGRGGE